MTAERTRTPDRTVPAAPEPRAVDPSPDLSRSLGARATAAAVFGEPVHHPGATVIPVARTAWGFGGGRGRGDASRGGRGGSGGGGGARLVPMGCLDIREDRTRFVSIGSGQRGRALSSNGAGNRHKGREGRARLGWVGSKPRFDAMLGSCIRGTLSRLLISHLPVQKPMV